MPPRAPSFRTNTRNLKEARQLSHHPRYPQKPSTNGAPTPATLCILVVESSPGTKFPWSNPPSQTQDKPLATRAGSTLEPNLPLTETPYGAARQLNTRSELGVQSSCGTLGDLAGISLTFNTIDVCGSSSSPPPAETGQVLASGHPQARSPSPTSTPWRS